MATARELLEQADALMRRNRARGDALAAGTVAAPILAPETAPAPEADADAAPPAAPDAAAADELDDFPLLTDVVDDREPISVLGVEDAGEPSRWPEEPRPGAHDADAAAPPAPAAASVDDEYARAASADAVDGRIEPTLRAEVPPPLPPEDADEEPLPFGVDLAEDAAPATGDEAVRSAALAEEVRMQVLQRLDIFTDTGLQEQLTARLQPIVDRASADLVAAINRHLGALLRAYVAEAIEREIEKLRAER